MIDWSTLKPYQNDKYRSFEELCYQIAKGLYGDKGCFTSIDDSGGGDGVEFYLTLPNGDQWGWQAKFYYPDKRLRSSNRKTSIKNSLEKACETHPRLKKWFLCTPTNFTPDEQTWFEDTQQNVDVELEHWGDSDFNNWLSEPRFRGKLYYFFGELEFDMDWFKRQFDKQMTGVGDKFDSSLHTETDVDAEIHALLGDKAFVHQITEWIEKLEEDLPDFKEAIDDLKRPIPSEIEWGEEEKAKVIGVSESLQDALVNIIDKFEQARKLLNKQKLTAAQAIDWRAVFGQLRKVFDNYEKVTMESGISQIKYIGEKEDEERFLDNASSIVYGPRHLVSRLLDKFFPDVIWKQGLINKSDLHILGDAGIGKTHIACNICDDRLKNRLPALFVRGNLFTTEQSIESQLRTIFDIPPSYSWHDFLQALSAAAEAYHTRIPLIIDGLNESVHNGTFSKIWELGLTGLVQEIAQAENVVLITTCRESYKETIWKDATSKEYIWKKMIWKDKDSLNLVYAYGFYTEEVKHEAIDKYFNAYKIKAEAITLAPLRQFEHPLHLKIFCETKNRERKTEVQVYVGEQTLFEIFDKYLEQCNKAICDRLNRHPKTLIVQPALNKMADHLWQNRSREIPFDKLVHIVDGQSREHLDWSSSKTRAIESEGLLVYRDWVGVGEVMHFTYDLLGGYLIAKYLVEQVDDVQGFLNSEEVRAALFSEDHQTLHPMHEDICRCLAALVPAETGHFLHEFPENKKAFSLSIRALFEISPQDITENCIRLVAYLFDQYQENREFFLQSAETTVGHSDHPFNASFWSERLAALSMSERDLSWTEYVRHNRYRYSFEKKLMQFEKACQDNQDLSEFSVKCLHLYAEYIVWILTSTVRPLRDQATRALYWYGRRFPLKFFDLVIKSFSINDPYVPERMLAATYGIAMACQNDFEDTSFVTEILPQYAKQLYENMFKPDASHATTHILTRDYARRTIDIALIHQPDLLTADERARITQPFTDGGIREWGESEERDKGAHEKGPAPLQLDFANYTLGCLVKDRGNYDFRHAEYKRVRANIFWRIYDLGYSLNSFGTIDKWIHQENERYGRSADGRKTDRYGKKYSWIAFYELAGFRQDNGLLRDYYSEERTLGVDIDPSFPDKQREYNLVTEDFLGDREVSAEEWIAKTSPPDLTQYLKVDHLCGEQGPWVLLKGYMSQKDDQANRDMFAFLHGLIVKSEDVEEIVEILKKQEKIDRSSLPFCPGDYYTYAGEVPWCDTYPENSSEDVSFNVETVSAPEDQQVILRNGEPVSDEELIEFLRGITDLIEKEDWEAIGTQLNEQGFEFSIGIEEARYGTFKVLVPVRENNWKDHRSAINSNRSVAIPSRQIAEALDLCGQPQSFDLFEKESGKRASITFRYGEGWGEMQRFTYLRQDLLERYLAETGSELIWIIWGERRQVSQNPDAPYKYFHEVKVYRDIQKASGD